MTHTTKNYTVAICTHNRAHLLEKCLAGLIDAMRDIPLDVIVIDNASIDETPIVCARFAPRVQYYFCADVGLSNARNFALRQCRTRYIVFLDDDAIPDCSWISGIDLSIDRNPDVFGGPYYPFYIEHRKTWFTDDLASAHLDMDRGWQLKGTCFSGGNMGWRTEILKELGGFDKNLGMVGSTLGLAEETQIQLKIWRLTPNATFWYEPSMSMAHYVHPSKMSLLYILRRNFLYGRLMFHLRNECSVPEVRLIPFIRYSKLGLPILFRLLMRDRTRYPYWKTYVAKYISLHSIHAGYLYSKYMSWKLIG